MRFGRRRFLQSSLGPVGLGVIVGCGIVAPQTPRSMVPRLGYLDPALPTSAGPRFATEAFLQGLGELGYVEGRDLTIEWRSAEGQEDRLPGLADELVRVPVDVIVAVGSAITAAKKATASTPIVFPAHSDPVGSGLVGSLARPGGNLTGLSTFNSQLGGKRLQLLKETAPGLSRLAVVWVASQSTTAAAELRALDQAARTLSVRLQSLSVRAPEDLGPAFEAMVGEGADGVIMVASPLFTDWRMQLVDLAAKHRLPVLYPNRQNVDSGGLMSYGANVPDLYRRAATYVDKILKGARPAELPVEQPTTFEFAINLKTARALGLTISPSVLTQATELIQ